MGDGLYEEKAMHICMYIHTWKKSRQYMSVQHQGTGVGEDVLPSA